MPRHRRKSRPTYQANSFKPIGWNTVWSPYGYYFPKQQVYLYAGNFYNCDRESYVMGRGTIARLSKNDTSTLNQYKGDAPSVLLWELFYKYVPEELRDIRNR